MTSDPLLGQVLHDTHEVLRLIGKGGMGSVYEARHVHLGKSFAVKVLDPRFAENENVFARFKREALIASSLGHPAIVQVVDFYLHEDGRPCMVMEYLEGRDLGEALKDRGSLPPNEVIEIVEQVGGALQAVHDRDIVHRDMKPGNVFLVEGPDGLMQAKVLDFGISKIKNPEDGIETLTTNHTILGTPHFMSPEQALGEVGDVDWRTDIFALGTICYYALSGKLPFNAPSLHGVLVKIQSMEAQPITGLVPGLPGKVHLVLQKAMAKDKEARYQRVEQFTAELRVALATDGSTGEEKGNAVFDPPELATVVDGDGRIDGGKIRKPEDIPSAQDGPAAQGPDQPGGLVDPHLTNVMGLDEVFGDAAGAPNGPPVAGVTSPAHLAAHSDSAPGVSPNTTLSSAPGEKPTLKIKSPPQVKKLSVIALAAAAAVVLAVGGGYLALRVPGNDGSAEVASTTIAASHAASPSIPQPPEKASGVVSAPLEDRAETPQPSASPEGQPAHKVVETKAKPVTRDTVSITLRLKPSSARVLLDGRPRSDNPLVLPKDGSKHRLRVEAEGHKAREVKLVADSSRTMKLILRREITKPARAAAPRKSVTKETAPREAGWVDPFKGKQKGKPKVAPAPKPLKKSVKGYDDLGESTLPPKKKKKKAHPSGYDSL